MATVVCCAITSRFVDWVGLGWRGDLVSEFNDGRRRQRNAHCLEWRPNTKAMDGWMVGWLNDDDDSHDGALRLRRRRRRGKIDLVPSRCLLTDLTAAAFESK